MLDALGYGAPAIIAWVLIVLHFIAGFVVVNTPLMLQLEEWAGVPRPFSAKMKGSQQQQSGKDIEGDGNGDASNDNVPITSDDLNLAAEKAMSLTVEDTVCASLTWKQRMISIAIRVAVICFEGTSLSIYLSIYLSLYLSISASTTLLHASPTPTLPHPTPTPLLPTPNYAVFVGILIPWFGTLLGLCAALALLASSFYIPYLMYLRRFWGQTSLWAKASLIFLTVTSMFFSITGLFTSIKGIVDNADSYTLF